MMQSNPSAITRRAALQWAVVSVGSLGLIMATPVQAATAAETARRAETETPGLPTMGPEPRFRFDPVSPLPLFAPLSRLEEVWASSQYMLFTDCVVTYIGEEPFALTAEEAAIVAVMADAGGDVSDPEYAYMLILAASSRIDPSRLHERLEELGRPVITASLALAPDSPQSGQFADWLAETA